MSLPARRARAFADDVFERAAADETAKKLGKAGRRAAWEKAAAAYHGALANGHSDGVHCGARLGECFTMLGKTADEVAELFEAAVASAEGQSHDNPLFSHFSATRLVTLPPPCTVCLCTVASAHKYCARKTNGEGP